MGERWPYLPRSKTLLIQQSQNTSSRLERPRERGRERGRGREGGGEGGREGGREREGERGRERGGGREGENERNMVGLFPTYMFYEVTDDGIVEVVNVLPLYILYGIETQQLVLYGIETQQLHVCIWNTVSVQRV